MFTLLFYVYTLRNRDIFVLKRKNLLNIQITKDVKKILILFYGVQNIFLQPLRPLYHRMLVK